MTVELVKCQTCNGFRLGHVALKEGTIRTLAPLVHAGWKRLDQSFRDIAEQASIWWIEVRCPECEPRGIVVL